MQHNLGTPPITLDAFSQLYRYSETRLQDLRQLSAAWEFRRHTEPKSITSEIRQMDPAESRVFFSYKREDEDIVRRFYNEMKSRGVQHIWMDIQELSGGDYWSDEIDQALQNATHLVLFVSKEAMFSPIIAHEVTTIESASTTENPRTIIPVILEDPKFIHDDTLSQDAELHQGEEARIQACETLQKTIQRINWLNRVPFSEAHEQVITELSRRLPKADHRLPELIHVSAGEFWMGERGHEQQIYLDDFWIGKWPITVSEFAHFVRDGGLKDTDLFPPAFNSAAYSEHLTRTYWPDEDIDEYTNRHPQQPMRGLTWLQAYAYCEWLNRVIDEPGLFGLPTSAQWEKAARGVNKNRYPWGKKWQPEIANTSEAGYGRVLDCGALGDAGNSPYGCQDMAGNIWEWTLSFPFEQNGDTDALYSHNMPRVLRGGDYKSDQSYTWTYSSVSDDMLPIYYHDTIGMRIIATRAFQQSLG